MEKSPFLMGKSQFSMGKSTTTWMLLLIFLGESPATSTKRRYLLRLGGESWSLNPRAENDGGIEKNGGVLLSQLRYSMSMVFLDLNPNRNPQDIDV